jgi:hypothetical protein
MDERRQAVTLFSNIHTGTYIEHMFVVLVVVSVPSSSPQLTRSSLSVEKCVEIMDEEGVITNANNSRQHKTQQLSTLYYNSTQHNNDLCSSKASHSTKSI